MVGQITASRLAIPKAVSIAVPERLPISLGDPLQVCLALFPCFILIFEFWSHKRKFINWNFFHTQTKFAGQAPDVVFLTISDACSLF